MNVASSTDVDVTLGRPVDSEPGLYIFPYMLSEDLTFIREASLRTPANGIERTADQCCRVNCLLMSSLPDDYVALDKGLKCLLETPVLKKEETNIQIIQTSPSIEDLTRVFISAGITLRLAFPFELRTTGKT